MNDQFQTFKELIDSAGVYLKSLSYSTKVVDIYSCEWRHLWIYMKTNEIQHYDVSIGIEYLASFISDIDSTKLSRNQRNRIRIITVLSDFVETGTIRKRKNKQVPRPLDGPIGKIMAEYIIYLRKVLNLATSTIQSHRLYLSIFLKHLNRYGVISLEDFSSIAIVNFGKSLTEYSVITKHLILLKSAQFLKYLYENQFLSVDFSKIIPKSKYVRQAKLPSYYSKEEIDRLINCVDRSNPNGKRDYAMILLSAKLGLRCSDISNLVFANILWEKELISLNQQKTKGLLELPLLPEIGSAIIDYLKYGRPQSDCSSVFLRHVPPYGRTCDNLLYSVVKKYMNLSGIKYDERRHGSHALRHSLATRLLEAEVSLPTISGVLGHIHTESTMFYLRVDTKSLRKCALEVPLVARSTRKEIRI